MAAPNTREKQRAFYPGTTMRKTARGCVNFKQVRKYCEDQALLKSKACKKGNEFMRVQKYLSALTLMAAMLVGTMAFAASQQGRQDGRHDDDDRDHRTSRYYDRHHRDYHEWNDRENRAYVNWESSRHKAHREFSERRNSDQSRYWAWRHSHPDND